MPKKWEHDNLPIWIYFEMHALECQRRMEKKRKLKSYDSLAMPSGQWNLCGEQRISSIFWKWKIKQKIQRVFSSLSIWKYI